MIRNNITFEKSILLRSSQHFYNLDIHKYVKSKQQQQINKKDIFLNKISNLMVSKKKKNLFFFNKKNLYFSLLFPKYKGFYLQFKRKRSKQIILLKKSFRKAFISFRKIKKTLKKNKKFRSKIKKLYKLIKVKQPLLSVKFKKYRRFDPVKINARQHGWKRKDFLLRGFFNRIEKVNLNKNNNKFDLSVKNWNDVFHNLQNIKQDESNNYFYSTFTQYRNNFHRYEDLVFKYRYYKYDLDCRHLVLLLLRKSVADLCFKKCAVVNVRLRRKNIFLVAIDLMGNLLRKESLGSFYKSNIYKKDPILLKKALLNFKLSLIEKFSIDLVFINIIAIMHKRKIKKSVEKVFFFKMQHPELNLGDLFNSENVSHNGLRKKKRKRR